MSSTEGCTFSRERPALPPCNAERLFIGNLVSSISDASLLRLIGKFGDTSHLERHYENGFAHVSMLPQGSEGAAVVDRCVNSLNRTSWCGTVLRVERAREHHLARLNREWSEERGKSSPVSDPTDVSTTQDCFASRASGKHTRFSFEDLDPATSPVLQTKPDSETHGHGQVHDRDVLEHAKATEKRSRNKLDSVRSQNTKLDSTLQLFGLQPESIRDQPDIGETSVREQISRPESELIARKRPRLHGVALKIGTDSTEDPTRPPVSIDDEKRTARSILQQMFSPLRNGDTDSITNSDHKLAAGRRLGLYRTLMGPVKETPRNFEEKLPENVYSKRQGDAVNPASEDKVKQCPSAYFRKAGLYRDL